MVAPRSARWEATRVALKGAGAPLAFALAFAGMTGSASVARAEEPRAPGEPRLLRETAEATSVVDAFDDGDMFDLHLFLGFEQRFKSSNIRRETALAQPGMSTGGFTATSENVARSSQSQSLLHLGADIGLWKDLALLVRLPIVLSDARSLSDLNGSAANRERRADPAGAELFSVPFNSPTRSGIDYIALGLDYAIFNQQRDDIYPTWVIGIGTRIGLGPPLRACNNDLPTGSKCPDPMNPGTANDNAGVSRAMNAFTAHTAFSKRIGNLEPYFGFDLLVEFPQGRSVFGQTSNLTGTLLNRPPIVGTVFTGLEVVPWEEREQFRRLVIDARIWGQYISPGRDYSELFDALGSSNAASLRSPNAGAYKFENGQSVADGSKVYFTGVTDVQAHGALGSNVNLTWQAGEYVKFNAGLGLGWMQSHLITSADACNPDVVDIDRAGPCVSSNPNQPVTGLPNPNHRPVIDLPGRRFSADDTFLLNFWLGGVVMF
jgi:hypothetical protein